MKTSENNNLAAGKSLDDSELIRQLGALSEPALTLFRTLVHERTFKKNQFLLHAGSVCRSFYFLTKGAVCQYRSGDDSEKTYLRLHVKNEWIVDNKSFSSQQPSDRNIEAFTDCELIEISIHALHKLIENSQTFLGFARILNQAEDRVAVLQQAETPAKKYQLLEQHHPDVIQTFPLKIIASYLKMTPETLSRVRGKR